MSIASYGHPIVVQRRPGHDISEDLIDLTIRDLIIQLARTEDQTRGLRLETTVRGPLLRRQHQILTELNRRDATTMRHQPAR